MHQLEMIGRQLLAPRKGLLAADESLPLIAKHFGTFISLPQKQPALGIETCSSRARLSKSISAALSCSMRRSGRRGTTETSERDSTRLLEERWSL